MCSPFVTALARIAVVVLLGAIVGSIVFNAIAYAAAARYRRRHPVACPLDDGEPVPWPVAAQAWLRAFSRECAVTALLTLTLPLAFRRQRIRPCNDPDTRRPLVLLHGWGQHTANFLWLSRRLRRDGWLHVYSVRHTAVGGDIERSATRLAATIDRIRRETGAPAVDVVAHSMGGLVARACVRAGGRTSGIGRLVTLGTPHQGSLAFPWFRGEPMLAQMRPESAFLQRLAADDPVPALVDCIAIYSQDDALVVPSSAGYWPGAFNIEVRGLGHTSLLFSRRVYELVRENLAAVEHASERTRTAWS
jgi:pimeloyl-ACP methyl ester carboxylesterase